MHFSVHKTGTVSYLHLECTVILPKRQFHTASHTTVLVIHSTSVLRRAEIRVRLVSCMYTYTSMTPKRFHTETDPYFIPFASIRTSYFPIHLHTSLQSDVTFKSFVKSPKDLLTTKKGHHIFHRHRLIHWKRCSSLRHHEMVNLSLIAKLELGHLAYFYLHVLWLLIINFLNTTQWCRNAWRSARVYACTCMCVSCMVWLDRYDKFEEQWPTSLRIYVHFVLLRLPQLPSSLVTSTWFIPVIQIFVLLLKLTLLSVIVFTFAVVVAQFGYYNHP